MMNLNTLSPYVSSVLNKVLTESKTFVNDIPLSWKEDLKNIDYNEILASSVSVIALVFNWNKAEKYEFTQIASGTLASTIIHGDPIGTIAAIISYAHSYTKQKRKSDLRKFKWATIEGLACVGAFTLSMKVISVPIMNYLVGICAALIIKKSIGTFRLFEYLSFLRKMKFKIKVPQLKKVMNRRELITLSIFK